MKKRKAKTAAADELPFTTLPGNYFHRNKAELPPGYKRPLRRPPPRKLLPLQLAYWREHQIKIASLAYLNSKRFSRHGNGMPNGTDFAVISRGTGEHRRLFYLDRLMPPPTPVVCSCLPTYRDLGGCGCEGGGGEGCGEGGCSESGSGCGEAGGGAGGCGAGGGGAGGCGGCACGGEAAGGGCGG